MSEADKLFEQLGYEKEIYPANHFYFAKYKKDADNIIVFEKDKEFYKTGEYDADCDSITMQELEAINMKCKELGWE